MVTFYIGVFYNFRSGFSKHEEPAIPPTGSDSDTEREEESIDYPEVHSPDLFEECHQYAKQGDPDENTHSMPYNQVLFYAIVVLYCQ